MKTRNERKATGSNSSNGKTPREIEKFEKRRPLREMIAKGKDPREATLMWVMAEILDSINWNEGERGLWAIKKDELPKMRSLLGQARKVRAEVIRCRAPGELFKISPKAWFYDPIFAELWSEIRGREFGLEIALGNLEMMFANYLKRKHMYGFKKQFKEEIDTLVDLVPKVHDDTAMLYVTIGFALGARTYRKEIADNLDTLKLNIMERFTIENPEMISEPATAKAVG